MIRLRELRIIIHKKSFKKINKQRKKATNNKPANKFGFSQLFSCERTYRSSIS